MSKETTHIKAVNGGFRLEGEHVDDGDFVPKNRFDSKGDWHTLVHMTPPRAVEEDPVKDRAPAKTELPKV